MTTTVGRDTNTCVDRGQERWGGEEAGRDGTGVKGREDGGTGRESGVVGGAGVRERGGGREEGVVMSTSARGEEGLVEVDVECCALMEGGEAAEP